MYSPDLYVQTMHNAEKNRPDFYLTMGDDFSLDRFVDRETDAVSGMWNQGETNRPHHIACAAQE